MKKKQKQKKKYRQTKLELTEIFDLLCASKKHEAQT
jgi:hypothetical protein